MIKQALVVSGILLLFLGVDAQDDKNLVKNPGFEAVTGKLKKPKQINAAKDWDSPTGERADLFSESLKTGEVAAPDNYKGREKPLEGENYAGVVMFSYGDKTPRTYIQTELLGPLKAGVEYCVKFNVSLSEKSKYAVNNIGAHLSKKAFEFEEKKNLLVDTHVKHSKNKVFNATYGWETVCAVYKAEGGEKFLTIGNFSGTRETKQEKTTKPKGSNIAQEPIAYYYIDGVSVFILDSIQECQCEKGNYEEKAEVVYDVAVASNKKMTPEFIVTNEKVFFGHMEAELNDASLKSINHVIEALNEDENMKITIHAHSEKTEKAMELKDEKAKDLAGRRANTVKAALEKGGISASRISVKVLDDKEPAATGNSELDKAKNRRVEFTVDK